MYTWHHHHLSKETFMLWKAALLTPISVKRAAADINIINKEMPTDCSPAQLVQKSIPYS